MLKTISEVKEQGWHALVERLGVAGATLFILEYEKGSGNYTEERKKIFDDISIDEIAGEIRKKY